MTSSDRASLWGSRLLLGEGRDDVALLRAMLLDLGRNDVQVESFDGKDRLASVLYNLPKAPGFADLEAIGITRDADRDAAVAFQSILGALQRSNLPKPEKLSEAAEGPPQVSIFLFPGEDRPGELEHLCLDSLAHDPASACVAAFADCLDRLDAPPRSPAKTRFYAWLSTRRRPDWRLAEAVRAGEINLKSAAFQSLRQFLEAL